MLTRAKQTTSRFSASANSPESQTCTQGDCRSKSVSQDKSILLLFSLLVSLCLLRSDRKTERRGRKDCRRDRKCFGASRRCGGDGSDAHVHDDERSAKAEQRHDDEHDVGSLSTGSENTRRVSPTHRQRAHILIPPLFPLLPLLPSLFALFSTTDPEENRLFVQTS